MRDYVLDGTRHAKLYSDRFMGFCSLNTCFCRASGVTSFLFVFGGFFNKATVYTLNRFLPKRRQMTSFRVWNEICAQKIKYMPQTSSHSGIWQSYKKSRSTERMVGSNFWSAHIRFCACAVKICLEVH